MNIDHRRIAELAAKKAISEISMSTVILAHDRELIWKELNIIANEITTMDVYNNDCNWLPLRRYLIGTQLNN